MGLSILLPLLALLVHSTQSTYVAIAPKEFHPGWMYVVQLTVNNVPGSQLVSVTGNILNNNQSVGSGQVSLQNGETKKLEIKVNNTIPLTDGEYYTLELVGSGGLTFTNTTSITVNRLKYLAFIQTDKAIYKSSQIVRWRALIVDHNLVPQKVPMKVTIENPAQSILAQYKSDGTKSVVEGELKLMEYPDLGTWKITMESENLREEKEFEVSEYVLPTFDVKASSTPKFLIKTVPETKVTISVDAKYTYGKGVKGTVEVVVLSSNKVVTAMIDNNDGTKNVVVDLRDELASQPDWGGSIQLLVKVKDETERVYNTTVTVDVASEPVRVQIDQDRSDMVYRSGTVFKAMAKVTDASDLPLTGNDLQNGLVVRLTEGYSDSGTLLFENTYPMIAGQRDVMITVNNLTSSSDELTLTASLMVNNKKYVGSATIKKYLTLGNSTFNVKWADAQSAVLSMGGLARFVVEVSANSQFDQFAYMIVSRGNIQAAGTVTPGQVGTIPVTTDMCPNGKLVVYGITTVPSGQTPEVIADSLNLKLEHCQDKTVKPSVTQGDTLRTGSDATISFKVGWTDGTKNEAVGEHEVFMLGIDNSILLLQGDNDISSNKVDASLDKFSLSPSQDNGDFRPMPWARQRRSIMPFPYPYADYPQTTGELFQGIGVVVLANARFEQIKRYPVYYDDMILEAAAVPGNPVAMVPTGGAGAGAPANVVTVRKDFPDTWIFKSGMTDTNGNLQITEKLPDSITSWRISAFAIKDDSELAVTANPFNLNAFNPFFVSLNLPYSIRRTEKFELRATVFNYENANLTASVQLSTSPDYEISGEAVKSVTVQSNGAGSVTFMIEATKVGLINLKVTATTQLGGVTVTDIVERKLIVRPEGIERMRAITIPVVLSTEQPAFTQVVTLDFTPWMLEDVVPDSRRCMVKITGDMMGNALEGIDKLVTQPTGCGEQNMITTIPNIYAMEYLNATGDVPPDFKAKATGYMVEGYQRQMQYKRSDHSFSAWGQQDDAGSTWLTCFVVRSFARAAKYIPNTVQDSVLQAAVDFLFTRNKGGLFFELGKVIHDEMTGGTDTGNALTIYIVVSLLEAQNSGLQISTTHNESLAQSINYVLQMADGEEVKTKQFYAAITAYALSLIDSKDPKIKAKVLRLFQNVVDSGAPWMAEEDNAQKTDYYWHKPPGSSKIEITSYLVLALLKIGEDSTARELVLWLQKNQNSNGGYSSTQDTVMALQAISEHAAKYSMASATTSRKVSWSVLDPAVEGSKMTANIDGTNNKILQIFECPAKTNKLSFEVTGDDKSLVVFKVTWFFYTLAKDPPINSNNNNLVVKPEDKMLKINTTTSIVRPGFHKVQACTTKKDGLQYSSMVVMTMNLPSGTEVKDIEETRKMNPNIPRIEQGSPDQVHFYMHEPATQCIETEIEEKVKVENMKPGTVELYAYYDPETRDEGPITLALQCNTDTCINNPPIGQATSITPLTTTLLAITLSLLITLFVAL